MVCCTILSTFLNFALLMGFFDSFFFSFGGFSLDRRLFAFKLASAAKSLSSSSSSSAISSSSTDAGDFTPEEDGPAPTPEEPARTAAGGGVRACACCYATRSGFNLGFLVDVPFRTSHMEHLNASALLRNVHTEQSQKFSSAMLEAILTPLFALRLRPLGDFLLSIRKVEYSLKLC